MAHWAEVREDDEGKIHSEAGEEAEGCWSGAGCLPLQRASLRLWELGPLQLAAELSVQGERRPQQLRCGAIFKPPLLCEQRTRALLSGIQKQAKKRTALDGGGGGWRGKAKSSFSLEITLTFSKIQEVLGLENYPQL